jgi:protease-4
MAACLVAFAAQAQQADWATAETPAESFALQDDGTSLGGNPGGLAFAHGLELDFLHNGFSRAGARGHTEALYGTLGTGQVTLAAGWDWLRRTNISARRTSLGLGLKMGWLGIGAAYRKFSGDFDFTGWDFGFLARPFAALSLGGAVQDANEPGLLPRRWRLSIGTRPFGELFELALDVRWSECREVSAPLCGFDHRDYLLTAQVPVIPGLRLVGQFGVLGTSTTTTLVGLQVDLGHLGFTWGPKFVEGGSTQTEWRLRLSSDRWPALSLRPGRAALLDLDKSLEHPKARVWELIFPRTRHDPLAMTLAALRRLGEERSVRAVVLRTSDLPIGLGKAEELRGAIESLQARGKKVIFYLESAGDLEYSLATSADRIYSAPQAVLTVNGFSATALFAAAGLDKLGVKAEFFRVGAYKNAPDLFTRSEMSGEQREVQNALLDDLFGRYVRRVSEKRRLDGGKLKALLDKGILKPQEALEAGLLDGLVYPDQLEEEVGKLLGGKISLEKTGLEPPALRETQWGVRPRITVVRVEGNILRGEGRRDPLGAVKVAGSEPIARRIRRAADDPEVKAIVVRIDSPGGDGTASDLIWRELVRARKEKKKPVIASMGDVAASGGYYVAAGADEIWAEPSTITGSIGVFVGHFNLQELYGKLGLTLTTLKRGESADIFSTARDLNDGERRTLQTWVENFYDQFVDRVAEARGLSREQVHAVAQGRVWTGAQAQERKLVDRLGSFEEAVQAAKKRAGISGEVDLDDEIEAQLDVEDLTLSGGVLSTVPGAARAVRALQLLGEPGTVRAILPYDLEVR